MIRTPSKNRSSSIRGEIAQTNQALYSKGAWGFHSIRKVFVLCVFLITSTTYYRSIKHIPFHGSSKSLREFHADENMAVVLGWLVSTDKVSETASNRKLMTELSRSSISTFIRTESKRIAETEWPKKNSTVELINVCGNSDRWLNAARYGNLRDDPFLTHDLVQHMLFNLPNALAPTGDMAAAVLGQTICHRNSRFLNHTMPVEPLFDERTVRLWSVKLIYLAVHYHQHRLAVPEALARYSSETKSCPTPQQMEEKYDVGIFDYECPDAKYIVMPLGGNGLGSNVRGGMIVALLMGLSSDRIVLFVNNANKSQSNMKKTWTLASCSRKDYQCFFWPASPCTLTDDEINDAHVLNREDYRKIIKKNVPLLEIAHHKVWAFNTPFMPVTGLPTLATETLYRHALTMISAVSEEKHPNYYKLLMEAAESIRAKDDPRPGYDYAAANAKVQHALAFYSLRPNPKSAHELDQILHSIIPESFPPESSIGLPIRASDKCKGESECLSFDQHMQVTSTMWQRHIDLGHQRVNPTVVFTTEATSMVQEQQAFVKEHEAESKYPFRFDFVTNSKDVTPDSGFMKDIEYNKDVVSDADAIMLSAMSSLKAQLLPRITIGNCCSNFHALLNDFLSEGCGAASDNRFLCLQEYDDPLLRVCCGWHKQCIAEKQALIKK